MIRLNELRVGVSDGLPEIKRTIERKLGMPVEHFRIAKKSLDARDKKDIHYVLSVEAEVQGKEAILLRKKNVQKAAEYCYPIPHIETNLRPVIVGSGPAGLFAALILAESGIKPIVIERGKAVEERQRDIQAFWQGSDLNENSNVQFGEGGAGTFSDGKLTTGTKDERQTKVLHEFVEAGAPDDILYLAKPHIGTDYLRDVVKNLREKIVRLGGEVQFSHCLTGIYQTAGRLTGIKVKTPSGSEDWDTTCLILALGHSARDTVEMLYDAALPMEQKAFAVGVRIEHLQESVNLAQYGSEHPLSLPPADYKLWQKLPSGRTVYTFCMCPGGVVVPAASEEGHLVTNGMSEYKRAERNANSALLVNVLPSDFESEHPLAGIRFQRKMERAAFRIAGDYRAPVQTVGNYIRKKLDCEWGAVLPSYARGTVPADLRECLPDFVDASLREALPMLDRKMHGFAAEDAVLTGVESRSSSPIRLLRDENGESAVRGIFPCGEGAGYAGGIMSAAVDGIRIAEKIMARLKNDRM